MTKAELRKIYLERRRSLSPVELHSLSEQIADRLFSSIDLGGVTTLHTFLPIVKFSEVDTTQILRKIWTGHPRIQTLVPLSDLQTGEMASAVMSRTTEIVNNTWGIPEPKNGDIVDPIEIDLVVVPLLCFDASGHRVGFGKGFYDRFLVRCRPDCRKVGVSYFPPLDAITDVDRHDMPLDVCVTPDKIYSFKSEA